MSSLKSTVKKLAVANQERKYNSELKSKKVDYDSWIKAIEAKNNSTFSSLSQNHKNLTIDTITHRNDGEKKENDGELASVNKLCKLISVSGYENARNCVTQYVVCTPEIFPQVVEMVSNDEIRLDGVILKKFDGILSKKCVEKSSIEFLENKSLILIYFDEDIIEENGVRKNPWFKPDWAPDDFLEMMYFGGVVAYNAEYIKKTAWEKTDTIYSYTYRMLLNENVFSKKEVSDGKLAKDRVKHIPEVMFSAYESHYESIKTDSLHNIEKPENVEKKVSIIIPSKDHPEILHRCIDSIINKTELPTEITYEIIVVDNGSSDENKKSIEKLQDKCRFKYVYEKKEFNFSYMCNLGAKYALGDYLLFLNDDMEIIEGDWLKKLVDKAKLPYAGAVGAKLLYPNSSIIQHAGITNLRIGPAHKLQFLSDDEDHYYGKNRGIHDVLAVTGACLLVKKAIFEEVGGFDENLAVAFNDVDICYKIYEKGYYNIVRCDVTLYHHESLSRGNDSESSDKQLRLNREKDYLYERHQEIYGKDPFYNVNLTTDVWEYEYGPKYRYEVKLDRDWAKITDITDVINHSREDKCVRVGMECAMDIFKWKYGVIPEKSVNKPLDEDKGFYFQGYTFVIGANNACFDRMLFIKNLETGKFYGIAVEKEYRPDISGNIPDQLNVDLAGYTAKIAADSVPKGHYQFGMYVKDKTSSLRIYNMSNWTLDV